MKNEEYIDINRIAEIKGLKSNRSLRMAIQKGKYVAREVTVFGGKSYEILYSSLEPEIQEKLEDENMKCTALVPVNNKPQTPSGDKPLRFLPCDGLLFKTLMMKSSNTALNLSKGIILPALISLSSFSGRSTTFPPL